MPAMTNLYKYDYVFQLNSIKIMRVCSGVILKEFPKYVCQFRVIRLCAIFVPILEERRLQNYLFLSRDMINDLRGKRNFNTIFYVLHHSMCLSTISIVIYYRVFIFHVCMRGLNEMSTPVLNLRWALKKFGMENERIYAMTEIAFVVTYFLGRIVTMPVFYYTILITKDTEGYQRLNTLCKVIFFGSAVVIDTLIIYWFLLICKMVFTNVKERSQMKGKED
uniref:TLC domain-containing protein 4-like isoform X2 n=1 Tax=Styela clava TaxID=7725 RepID=UPI00193A90EA|nr:TLC domain-containing protein 4-like isoform X2 [Styela clava]